MDNERNGQPTTFVRATISVAIQVLGLVARFQWHQAWYMARLWWLFSRRTPAERLDLLARLEQECYDDDGDGENVEEA